MAKEQITNYKQNEQKDSQSTKGTIFFHLREMHQTNMKALLELHNFQIKQKAFLSNRLYN